MHSLAPVINNVPDDITIDCIDDVPAKVNLEATDDDDPSFPKMITPIDMPEAADIDPVCIRDTILRIWTAQDASNNITRDTQLIIILPDETPPTVGLTMSMDTVSCEIVNDANNPLSYGVWKATIDLNVNGQIMDNCSDLGDLTITREEDIPGPCGTREYKVIITDNCNNETIWSSFYTVLDTIGTNVSQCA